MSGRNTPTSGVAQLYGQDIGPNEYVEIPIGDGKPQVEAPSRYNIKNKTSFYCGLASLGFTIACYFYDEAFADQFLADATAIIFGLFAVGCLAYAFREKLGAAVNNTVEFVKNPCAFLAECCNGEKDEKKPLLPSNDV